MPVSEAAPPILLPARVTRPPDELRRVLRLLVGLVIVLLVGGSSLFLAHLRHEALAAAAASTAGVVRLLEEHLGRTLSTTDTILKRMVRVTQARMRGDISADTELQEVLELAASLPERGSILVVDTTGKVVAAPTQSGAAIDFSDREWFRAHAQGTELVVGPLIHGRYSKDMIFTVSRRIAAADGGFAGVAVAGIETAFFTDFFHSLGLGANGYCAAVSEGKVMLRQPNPDAYIGTTTPEGKLLDPIGDDEPSGTLRIRSLGDGIERIVSHRTLPGFNVVVSAGMAVNGVLAPWRQIALLFGSAALVVTSGLLGLAIMAFRGIAREEAMLTGLEATVRDRTEEAERRALEARQANESKTRFLAAASHDLRQPLQAAGMFAEVLATSVSEPRQVEAVDKLRQSIEATNSLLTTLLDVSALEAGKTQPNVTTFRLMPLLAGLVDQMEPEATARGLSIGAIPTDVRVVSDPVLLERLLRNLLVNAVRYTKAGGVRIGCRHRGDRVVIQVVDTGIGIAADKIQSVFDDFVRIENPNERRPEHGLGLGLGVVRRMAALLGHDLELRSRPGRGSCFGVVVFRG